MLQARSKPPLASPAAISHATADSEAKWSHRWICRSSFSLECIRRETAWRIGEHVIERERLRFNRLTEREKILDIRNSSDKTKSTIMNCHEGKGAKEV